MVGNHSCRPQSMVHIKQFNFFLSCHDFSLLFRSTPTSQVAPHMGPMVSFKVYNIALNVMKNT